MAEPNDKFPWQQLGVLSICRLAEPVAFVSIVAYAYLMVQDINGEQDASFYAGLLVSAFALAEASTCWIWGHLSDRYGRKPIIMVALAGTALSSLIFGFATKYWIALLARVVGGALNGNVAVMQTMVAEMVHRPEHEPRAYALQPFMWSLGAIAGSSLGGFTAQPAKYYPKVFSQDGIFGRFPYLLPNLIAVAIVLTAMVLGLLFLEETNPDLISQKQGTAEPTTAQIAHETAPLLGARRDRAPSIATARSGASVPYVAVQVPLPNDPNFDLRRSSIASVASLTAFKKSIPNMYETHDTAIADEDEPPNKEPTKTFTKAVITWIVALWLLCYHQMAFSSLLPVYLLDDPAQPQNSHHLDLHGGLGQTLPQVGTILAVNSIISLLVQGVVFPLYVHWLGVWYTVVTLTLASPIVYAITPFVTLLGNAKLGVYIVLTMQSLFTTMNYPILLILIKNATPSPSVLGRVNGLAMSGCSGARTIAPPLVGILYSAGGSAVAWWSCGVIAVVAIVQLCFSRRPPESKVEAEVAREESG
ncbi:hypothetical protein OHC33_007553 [Knufia fluminis]|uniref:Major facilitator superfamily (MFS) profile domain-containing protein n=1 Tax=Knufia fluminis TaxID=191047 RepID=A0AAN8I2L5_9EURO|nr:hypothetical protein OHC33_007553 [Knufia fluminis]